MAAVIKHPFFVKTVVLLLTLFSSPLDLFGQDLKFSNKVSVLSKFIASDRPVATRALSILPESHFLVYSAMGLGTEMKIFIVDAKSQSILATCDHIASSQHFASYSLYPPIGYLTKTDTIVSLNEKKLVLIDRSKLKDISYLTIPSKDHEVDLTPDFGRTKTAFASF